MNIFQSTSLFERKKAGYQPAFLSDLSQMNSGLIQV